MAHDRIWCFCADFGRACGYSIFVNVDQYRPQIVSLINEKINGKIEIGKLTLSLWGKILIRVDGIDLKDAKGKSVFSVKDTFFHVAFDSILKGSPELTFNINTPDITVIKNREGKLNLMSLMKPSAPDSAAPGQSTGATAAKVALPGLVLAARLGVDVKDAKIIYTDELTKLNNELSGFQLKLRDVSIQRPTLIELSGQLQSGMGKLVQINGPFSVHGSLTP